MTSLGSHMNNRLITKAQLENKLMFYLLKAKVKLLLIYCHQYEYTITSQRSHVNKDSSLRIA